MAVPYVINLPEDFDEYAWEIEAKGWFSGVTVDAAGLRYRPSFYDPVRLAQTCEDDLAAGRAHFAEANLVIIESVTRERMCAAIAEAAQLKFSAWVPE